MWLWLQMQRQQNNASRNMKNQGNIIPPKDQNNLPAIDSKDIELHNLPDKEFKIALFKEVQWTIGKCRKIINKNNTQIKIDHWLKVVHKKETNRNSRAAEYNLSEKNARENIDISRGRAKEKKLWARKQKLWSEGKIKE